MNSDIDEIFKGRIRELSDTAALRGCFTFTDFLNPAQLSYISGLRHSLAAKVDFYGGYENAERVTARFRPEEETGYEIPFPITLIQVMPLNAKFSDNLTHRDFLGALLNLGIDRRLTGDIITDGSSGWIFVKDHIAGFVEESLIRVRHTSVEAKTVSSLPEGVIQSPARLVVITPSLRLDALVSKVFNLSRKESEKLIVSEKVFVNSIVHIKGTYMVSEGDIISVRGRGRFRYLETLSETKKGNKKLVIEKY